MIKINVISGFLGAGKTTLIKKLVKEAYCGEKVVLIENEFGEIGIDGGFLRDAGIEITEMNSGCICCSLVGDFGKALRKVIDEMEPERIVIEPSGVGKLSDIVRAVASSAEGKAEICGTAAVVDAGKCKMYMKNFGEFFNDQIETADAIILSHSKKLSEERIKETVGLLHAHNPDATVITTEWEELSGSKILEAMESKSALSERLRSFIESEDVKKEEDEHCHCHDDHETDSCGHDHDHHDHEHEHCHCHGDEHDHEHEHVHEHDDGCSCGCHGHHADEVFSSWGVETAVKYTEEQIRSILEEFDEDPAYGMILRAKGIVEATDGGWIHFDYVPGEIDVRRGSSEVTGRICVIGSGLNEEKISALFRA